MAGQMLCVWNVFCATDERWHDAGMTSRLFRRWLICVFLCLWSVTERGERRHSDKTSITVMVGVCLMKANSFHFCRFSHHSFSSPPYLHADGGVGRCKWGVGAGLGLPSSLSVYLSVILSCPSIVVYLSDGYLNPCGGWVCSLCHSGVEAESSMYLREPLW